jgi:hypothetical protein
VCSGTACRAPTEETATANRTKSRCVASKTIVLRFRVGAG